MQSHSGDASFMVKKETNDYTSSSFAGHQDRTLQGPIEVSSSEEDDSHDTEDTDDPSVENASKQLVLYDPVANGTAVTEPAPQPIQCQPAAFGRNLGSNMPSRVLPSVGAFTVQCADCFKWRLIPTKEKYEEIREHILEQPFYCKTACEWRPDISCDDPTDISQDGSRLWAIDKPNIAQPPRGWQRLLRIRGEGSTKFADVYYESPSGKRLRSMVEIQKYLMDHPEYVQDGVTLSQFSFQIPKPLQENYVRKRPAVYQLHVMTLDLLSLMKASVEPLHVRVTFFEQRLLRGLCIEERGTWWKIQIGVTGYGNSDNSYSEFESKLH
ncbi:hypothetical protein GH714_026573 [Hevea brasiliensis]|uniref:MBD domain-containing protein n=1 Tax=Hevea brasiliensis TaxID=3981 RepID=A0A6A6ML46_HEVBR|nr:hypothetical protein GH714_026573 [Hevea brasiliensis]